MTLRPLPPSSRAAPLLLWGVGAWLSACDGTLALPSEGSAELTWQRGEEPEVRTVYDPLQASIRITPPIDGEVEVTFEQSDPFARLQLRVDAAERGTGSEVMLPTADDTLSLEFALDDRRYLSTAPATGTLLFDELVVGEESADVHATFEVVLPPAGDASGPALRLSGFLQAQYLPAGSE